MNRKRLLNILAAAAGSVVILGALNGCSTQSTTIQPHWTAKKSPFSTMRIEGSNRFVCSLDEKGMYWRHVGTTGVIRDMKGRRIGTQVDASTLVDSAGRRAVLSSPERTGPGATRADLPDVAFRIDAPASGPFARATAMTREKAVRGMPLSACAPSQRGQVLKVPFSALLRLWR